MYSLHELQRAFARALCDPAEEAICSTIAAAGLTPSQRVQVYRNNVLANLGGALESVFPVLRRLVGSDFFGYAARRYVREVASRSGDLHDFGSSFPEFLAELPRAASLAYLSDVGRLEWAYHRVFHASDGLPLDLAALGKVPPDEWPGLRFVLNAASDLLQSAYPILRIWQVNQDDWSGDRTVHLEEGPSALLIRRRHFEMEFLSLSTGEYQLLASLASQCSLDQALGEALTVEPDFNLGQCLERHLRSGTFVGVLSSNTHSLHLSLTRP